jgi:hypothetical protein
MTQTGMKRWILASACVFGACLSVWGHDVITTKITWNREISRIVYDRCSACHHDGGTAFSLMTYAQARPWAVSVKEEVLSRRMPPWGAVKGFGDFRNESALSPEQLELITAWVDGGDPEGDASDLPDAPKFPETHPVGHSKGEITVNGAFKLTRSVTLDGLIPEVVPDKAPLQITAEFPDGRVEPLVWLYEYSVRYAHPFLLRTPLDLPRGTVIRGVPSGSKVLLLPVPAP